jgi:hypothetical protein
MTEVADAIPPSSVTHALLAKRAWRRQCNKLHHAKIRAGECSAMTQLNFKKTKAPQSRAFDEYLFLSGHFASLAI